MTLVQAIRQLRASGETVKTIAAHAGCSETSISDWGRGVKVCSLPKSAALIRAWAFAKQKESINPPAAGVAAAENTVAPADRERISPTITQATKEALGFLEPMLCPAGWPVSQPPSRLRAWIDSVRARIAYWIAPKP